LHTAQLMPRPLTVCRFSKVKTGFDFLVPAHPGSPGQRAVKRVFVFGLIAGTLAHRFGPFLHMLHVEWSERLYVGHTGSCAEPDEPIKMSFWDRIVWAQETL